MRKYQPIWNELKRTLEESEENIGKCSIAAHPKLHARMIKAVCREKNNDLGYKIALSERKPAMKAIVYSKREGSRIRFWLRLFFADENNISVEDL